MTGRDWEGCRGPGRDWERLGAASLQTQAAMGLKLAILRRNGRHWGELGGTGRGLGGNWEDQAAMGLKLGIPGGTWEHWEDPSTGPSPPGIQAPPLTTPSQSILGARSFETDCDTPYPSSVYTGSPPVHTGSPSSLLSTKQTPAFLLILGAHSPFPVHTWKFPHLSSMDCDSPHPLPNLHWETHFLSQYKLDPPHPFPVHTGSPQPLPSPYWEPTNNSHGRQVYLHLQHLTDPRTPGSLPQGWGGAINTEEGEKAPRAAGQELGYSGPYWENPHVH